VHKELLPLRGIVTVLNTPFTDRDAVDLASLRRNVRRALAAGVAGFLVPAMASEVDKLSESERLEMVAAVVDESSARVPVIGGASAAAGPPRQEIARRLIGLGCAGILVSIPFEGEERYRREIEEIASLQPEFLMIQDWDFRGFGLPVELVARLFRDIPCFRALKVEVVPAGVKYSRVLEATEGRLHVSGGWAVMQMIEALARGVHAFMPTGMHELYVKIYRLYAEGRRPQAAALFERLLPVLAFSNQHLDISIHFFKRLLHAEGTYATDRVRPPILPFDEVHRCRADELIERARALTVEIAVGHDAAPDDVPGLEGQGGTG
jgi:dihydrodipicolinate synthase/N-acetylneuraminate lyase